MLPMLPSIFNGCVCVVWFTGGKLLDKDGERFKFVVRANDHNYNQQHYDALGEVSVVESHK